MARLGLPTPPHLPRAVGRDRCGGTGYRGRVGVYELLTVDGPIRELILRGGRPKTKAPAPWISSSSAVAVELVPAIP